MTRRAFQQRQDRIAAGRCPRCDLPVQPWPIRRPDACHVAGAIVCPRHWPDIIKAEQRITVSR